MATEQRQDPAGSAVFPAVSRQHFSNQSPGRHAPSLGCAAMSNGHRVLVIEDEADLRALLAYNLEAWGYEVRAVDSGKMGLRSFDEFSPDLVLLDLMLPDVSGIEVCRKI